MAEVLVLVDHARRRGQEGHLRAADHRPRARRAVRGRRRRPPARPTKLAEDLAEYGAEKVYVAESDDVDDYLVAPKADGAGRPGRAQASRPRSWSPVDAEGKEIAGRLAVKLDTGLLTDAVDVDADGTATQSIFGGA